MRRAAVSLISAIGIAVVAFAMPAKAFAATVPFYYGPVLNCTGYFNISTDQTGDANEYKPVTDGAIPNNPNSSKPDGTTLPPCQSLCDVFILINNIVKMVVSVLITIFTPAMFVIGGIYILTSGGNPGNRATGKKIITGTLIGLALTLTATLIVSQMMTLIFQREWGEALTEKLAAQPQTGVTTTVNFGWNSLTCSPKDGAVAPAAPPSPAGGGTTDPPGGRTATPGACYSDADKSRLTCALGWVRLGTPLCSANKWNFCAMSVATDSNTCYPLSTINAHAYVCEGAWVEHEGCPPSGGDTFRACRPTR